MKPDPILSEFGLTPKLLPSCPIPVITHEDLESLCDRQGPEFSKKLFTLSAGQTCSSDGMYHYDVAAMLKTIQTGIELEDWD